ncbi:unnamed protein product [Lepeophtheirus salmonis]|uniref:(salmon louse) hypothetical protein n=1 Tax=Lepeophtheirus salmonis TaxID=72036 RepID=A0A7R8CZP7_LEPSM|nr:unnamed protein product [Lepeophtheirus salmonis]CAF2977915.1 unnamed protein product [Lepeophtheirus salmonis]
MVSKINTYVKNLKESKIAFKLIESKSIKDEQEEELKHARELPNIQSTNFCNESSLFNAVRRIQFASFDGALTEFSCWRESFEELIILSNMYPLLKFSYLKNCLKDELLSRVVSLSINKMGYDEAMKLLETFEW